MALGESSPAQGEQAENPMRSDQPSEQQAQEVCTQSPSLLGHGAAGEGEMGTCHSNEAITLASLLQLTEVSGTQPVCIYPARCRGRNRQVGGRKGDQRNRYVSWLETVFDLRLLVWAPASFLGLEFHLMPSHCQWA